MRISDWSSDVCSSDLHIGDRSAAHRLQVRRNVARPGAASAAITAVDVRGATGCDGRGACRHRFGSGGLRRQLQHSHGGTRQRGLNTTYRSEEHTSELQSLMRTSYADFRLKTQTNTDSNPYK